MNNPVSTNWYADPESRVYGDTVYMYVTKSLPFEEQLNLDLVTTKDLENFEIYKDILDMSTFSSATFAVWAPTVVERKGKYYLIFAANDIHSEDETGGLYIGVSDDPKGPFKNVLKDGKPLLNKFYNGAQPIDAHFFKDDDGEIYLIYGGWCHMNVCIMNDEMNGFKAIPEPCADGVAREITPADYKEAPYVMKVDGKYHLMYSTGTWTNGTYAVKAAVTDNLLFGFEYYDTVLKSSDIAVGPGHNSAFCFKGKHFVAYHRRIPGDKYPHNRLLCIDKLEIKDGKLQPVTMT